MNAKEPPKFFVHPCKTREESEQIWQAIRSFAHQATGWQPTDRRVYAVSYQHNMKHYEAVVGELHEADGGPEPVCAILETPNCWLVCTPNRGVIRGMPLLIGFPHKVVDFAA